MIERTNAVETQYEHLHVEVYPDEAALGQAAALRARQILKDAVELQGSANLILATGNSQLSFLRALRSVPDIPWSKITVFHMDEYLGIDARHPASFRRYIRENIVEHVRPAHFFPIEGDNAVPEEECHRYEKLLKENPVDLCCMGIGENGHLAFNDPPYADFNDDAWVKVVALDQVSRQQQVGEGHFKTLADVPTHAITLTIPALLAARELLVIAPERRKAQAVYTALTGPISEACPASILRQAPHARLYLDKSSASLLTLS
jgi:glucosamine-6-phosphate deaminase